MSDAVTTVDIEDVLASIRRLVMEGPDEPEAARSAAPPPPPRPGATGRLVLTPALRVVPPAAPHQGPAPQPLSADLMAPRSVEPEAAPEAAPEAPASEAQPSAAVPAQDAESSDAPEPTDSPPLPRLLLADPVTEAPADDEALLHVLSLSHDPPSPELPEPQGWEEEDDLPPEADSPLVFRSRQAADAQATATPDTTLHPEPTPSRDAFGPDPDYADDPRPVQAQTPGADSEPLLIDDEMLRTLVRDTLRAELQGELGERITQNIRKLVRREIFRVLASRDLD